MPIDNTFESIPLRDGHVSSYDPATHTARIVFGDMDGMVSYPFPVLLPNTLRNKDEIHLDAGEHVMCLCFGNGIESGVVLGCVYDEKNPPPAGDQDKRLTVFEDGASVEYDRAAHELTVATPGTVTVKAAGGVFVEGDVSVIAAAEPEAGTSGAVTLNAAGGMFVHGDISVSGNITASGSISDGGGNTNHHSH